MAGDRRIVVTLHALIFVCLLAAASGLQLLHDDPSTNADITAKQFNHRRRAAIVIDLGNTNSCVAGKAEETMFQHCIPSWVAFTDDGAALVGEAAMNYAEAHPDAAIFGYKRLLGLRRDRSYDEEIVQGVMERVPYKVGTRDAYWSGLQVYPKVGVVQNLNVDKITSMVMTELKKKAEEHLGRLVEDAVITVPVHFHDACISDAMFAGKLAGLDVVSTVFEPFAAADAYGLRRKLSQDGNALVLHVGGGTADASVVTLMDGGYFEILGYLNDNFLGGDDFDQRTVDYFVELIKRKHGKDISQDRIALRKLRTACKRAKKALSSQDLVQVSVETLFDGVDFSEPLSRSKFEELNEDLFHKLIAMVERVMVEAELEKNNSKIDEVVLIGGSTMIPKIQELVKRYFDGKEVNVRVKPDEAVALGAANRVHSSD